MIKKKYSDKELGIALKIWHAEKLTEDEYNIAKSLGFLTFRTYENYLLHLYEDDRIRCYIHYDKEDYLKGEWRIIGEYPTKLRKDHLSPKQIEILHEYGWSDNEIGSEIEQEGK